MVNWERRTWSTIYITLKWDPEHVFLSVRLRGQLMDKQKPTCFLFHCPVSCLFRAGRQLFSGLSLRFLFSWLRAGVDYSLNLFAFSLLDLLFLPLGFLTHSLIAYTPTLAYTSFLFHVVLYLTYSPRSCLFLCGFWAMLSSPTVILQPYGLPVYPQTTTCYPSIVQVKSPFTL